MSPPTATADIRRNVFSAEDDITVQRLMRGVA